ncbi:MAG TPA: hypothetical protein VGJ15_06820, partial [Pirellulales bacterium]
QLLAERAVLTRAVCRELAEINGRFNARRPMVALSYLLRWVSETMPEALEFKAAAGNMYQREPRASDGIDQMVVPAGCESLLEEIRNGASVADTLGMLLTADSMLELQNDEATVRQRLAAYWEKHANATRALMSIECHTGIQ